MRYTSVLGIASSIALFAAGIGACGDDGTTRNTAGTSADGGSGQGGAAASTGAGGSCGTGGMAVDACPAPAPGHPDSVDPVNMVTATIQDRQGNPAADIISDVCGTDKCLFAEADANGMLNLNAMNDTLRDVRLLYGDGFDWVKMSTFLPSLPDATFGTINAVRLPAVSTGAEPPCLPVIECPGDPLPSECDTEAATDVVNGDVTLSVESGANVDFDGIVYTTNEDRTFRSVTFRPGDGTFPHIDATLNLDVLYGMAPINTEICPAAKMTVPNSEGYAANAVVEFFLHGTLTFFHWAPYGGWAKVSEGVVSADGMTISTNDGEGIPILGTIGIRVKP